LTFHWNSALTTCVWSAAAAVEPESVPGSVPQLIVAVGTCVLTTLSTLTVPLVVGLAELPNWMKSTRYVTVATLFFRSHCAFTSMWCA
jgi:hypothetical protein